MDGVGETVEAGRTGFLLSNGNVVAVSSALEELVVNNDLRLIMGNMGYSCVQEKISAQKITREVNGVIKDLLTL